MIYIHKLGIELIIPAGYNVGKGVCGIERRKNGYAEKYCMVMQRNIVGY